MSEIKGGDKKIIFHTAFQAGFAYIEVVMYSHTQVIGLHIKDLYHFE